MTTYEQPKDWIERHLVEDPGGLLACEPSGLNEELKLARQANEFQHQQLAMLKNELRQISIAIDDLRLDLTHTEVELITETKRQLANATKQNVLLRDALEYHQAQTRPIQRTEEALAATDDLSGLVLCDAEPVAWMFEGLTGTYFGKEDKLPRPEAIQLFRRKQP